MAFNLSTGMVNRLTGFDVNLTQNGDFETDPTVEWTAADATLTSVAGGVIGNALQISETGGVNPGKAYQDHTTIAGRVYQITGNFKKGTSATGKILVGTTTVENQLHDSGALSDAAWTQKQFNITAADGTTRLTLQSDSTTAGETSLFDEFKFVDISARISDILKLGKIAVYSGTQPANADTAAAGTLLVTISNNATATGLTVEPASGGAINKTAVEIWSGVIASAGTAGWFRFYENGDNPASASTTAARFDGAIGVTSSFEMQLANTSLITGGPPFSVRSFTLTLPLS